MKFFSHSYNRCVRTDVRATRTLAQELGTGQRGARLIAAINRNYGDLVRLHSVTLFKSPTTSRHNFITTRALVPPSFLDGKT